MKPLFYYILASFVIFSHNANATTFATNNCMGKKLAVFGDSLVAGYGLEPGFAFPEQLDKKLDELGIKIDVINAGISGDTTSGGLARLDWSVGGEINGVILELGANDALRGISPEITEKNLDVMISKFKEKNIEVLLAGMMAPPNMGSTFGKSFNGIYPKLAKMHEISLYPFFLEGVAANPKLNQQDGIHPTKEGIAIIVDKTMPSILEFLKKVC